MIMIIVQVSSLRSVPKGLFRFRAPEDDASMLQDGNVDDDEDVAVIRH